MLEVTITLGYQNRDIVSICNSSGTILFISMLAKPQLVSWVRG